MLCSLCSGIVLVVGYMQIDNQLPLTPMPVLLAPECKEKEESVLEIVLEMKSDSSEVKEVYPCIALKTTESPWRLNIHEEMIWVAVEMYSYLRLDRLSSDSDVVQVDPEIQVELLHMSEVRFKLTIETCPEQRPPGKLGIWGPIVSTVGNISKMPVHLHNIIRENRYMRKSQVTTAVVDHIKHDLVHQPLQLLMGINLWGMTSSTLGTMSRGAASLSNDSSYLQMRSNQEKARRVRGVRDGVLQGTSTFARGVSYGFKGIVTKPAEGVRTKGVKGAFQGVAKAIVGVIVQPISGCLDFGALMVSGVGTSCTDCFAAIEQEPTFERSRLPRAIQGKVLTTYNEHSAQGQAILHLVQSRFLGKDVFRERGQSSHSDYYQAHFYLPQDFILLLTNRHVSMLKPPAAHARDPNKELTNPRTIEWKVRWAKLVNPFSSLPASSSSSLVQLHCQDASNQFTKVIECFQPAEESGNSQALQICEAIQHYRRVFCSDPEVLPTAKTRRLRTNMFKHRSANKKTNLGRKNHKAEETTNCSLKDHSEEGTLESSSNSQLTFQELKVEQGETDSPEINEEIIPT
jgi:vacuolar protein sorting-associated protein 13A/C